MFGSRVGFSAELRFLRYGLHTRITVERLPLRQLGFLFEKNFGSAICLVHNLSLA